MARPRDKESVLLGTLKGGPCSWNTYAGGKGGGGRTTGDIKEG